MLQTMKCTTLLMGHLLKLVTLSKSKVYDSEMDLRLTLSTVLHKLVVFEGGGLADENNGVYPVYYSLVQSGVSLKCCTATPLSLSWSLHSVSLLVAVIASTTFPFHQTLCTCESFMQMYFQTTYICTAYMPHLTIISVSSTVIIL
jgi:hypothetical protein